MPGVNGVADSPGALADKEARAEASGQASLGLLALGLQIFTGSSRHGITERRGEQRAASSSLP